MITVLFSSAGRRVELMECFRDEAQHLGVKLRVHATDLHPELSSACACADQANKVPSCASHEFIPALLEICQRENVGLVVPTIDTELAAYAAAREQFSRIGTRVAIGSVETVAIARDKLRTSEFLQAAGIPTPGTCGADDLKGLTRLGKARVLMKPRDGSASKGIHVLESVGKLSALHIPVERYVAQEFLEGREYTVNCFFDLKGRLRCAVPHRRIETRAGEVSKGVTERNETLCRAAQALGQALPGPSGAMCFQAMVDETGQPRVFEINARFGGGYPLAHRAGARFARWLVEETMTGECSASDDWQAGLLMLRYDAAVFREPGA